MVPGIGTGPFESCRFALRRSEFGRFRSGRAGPHAGRALLAALLAGLAWGCQSGSEFRVRGDLSEYVTDGEAILTQLTALVSENEQFAAAPIRDGQFEISGTTWGPRVVSFKVLVDGETRDSIQIVIEPGEDVRVSYGDWISQLGAVGGPYHRRLITSWQTSAEYVAALDNYRDIMTRKRALEDAGINPTGALEGELSLLDRAWAGWEALDAIRKEALGAWVRRRDDPLASLLAMELGGRDGSMSVPATLDELEPLLPEEVVRLQLMPMRARSEVIEQIVSDASGFEIGELVTDFTAPDLEGNPVRLYGLLAENEIVLIDFWATWCAPCLAQFPLLKELRAEYRGRGFEIFGFSVDAEEQVWRDTSEEYELTWPDVSDGQALSSPVAIRYAATILPFNYLLDSEGRVLGKRLMPGDLEAELEARLGPP